MASNLPFAGEVVSSLKFAQMEMAGNGREGRVGKGKAGLDSE
jgi:hypothetical protein